MRVIIVESPTKAKTLSAYINDKIIASKGHIAQLPAKNNSIDVQNNFAMNWQYKNIEHLKVAYDYSEIILATDNDREGEGIAWHIAQILKKVNPTINIKRAIFNSIDKPTFLKALQNLDEININRVYAYFARLSLDYLFGFNMSPFLWRKLPGNKSAGRVQSVALQVLANKEKEIRNFIPQTFFKIQGIDQNQNLYILQNFKTSIKEEGAKMLLKVQETSWLLVSNNMKYKTEAPPPPFNTATLQQKASEILGFNAKRTMIIAQKLYEGIKIGGIYTGLITYMRTDSLYMQISNALKNQIYSKFGINYFKETFYGEKTAHCAIYPTNFNIIPEEVPFEFQALYKLIYNRALESQMSLAQLNVQEVVLNSKVGKMIATKNIYLFDGFYKNRKIELNKLAISPNTHLTYKLIEEITKAPAKYHDGSLIKELSILNIGRPSTYDKIISTLIQRKYIIRDKKSLRATLNGLSVNELLSFCFFEYINPEFTSSMELQLNLIATKELEYTKMLNNFWQLFNNKIKQTMISSTEIFSLLNSKLESIIPLCNICVGKSCIKYSKYGCFFACTKCNRIQKDEVLQNIKKKQIWQKNPN